jgi:hypothetical protein
MANKVLGIKDGTCEGGFALEPSSTGLFFFWQKDGSRVYYVLATDLTEYEDTIVVTAGIPQIGDTLNNAPVRRLRARETERIKSHPTTGVPTAIWEVTVETDSRFDASSGSTGSSGSDDPTDFTPKRRWYTDKVKERRSHDLSYQRIETSAGEQLNFEIDFVDIILEIERYEAYPTDPDAMFNYAGHSNDDEFYGAPEGTVLLDDIQSDEEVINGVTYIKVRYVFRFVMRELSSGDFRTNTVYFARVANVGYLYRPAIGAAPITFLDAHGNPAKVPLDLDGLILAPGVPMTEEYVNVTPGATFADLNLEF